MVHPPAPSLMKRGCELLRGTLRNFPHPPGCRAQVYAGFPDEDSPAHPLLSFMMSEGVRVVALNRSPADEPTEVKTMLRSGVTVDEIKVIPANRPRADTDIVKAVRDALERDALIPDRHIQVAVSNGWVALTGSVALPREREDAERIVRRLEGVRGVYNLLRVKLPEARTDNVRDAIGAALKRHAEREAEGIAVSLREGTANLTGKVHTWAEKQVILGALKCVPGVERVNDQLSIEPYF